MLTLIKIILTVKTDNKFHNPKSTLGKVKQANRRD